MKRTIIVLLILTSAYLGCIGQLRYDLGINNRFSYASAPKDSIGHFGLSWPFRICNKIEFYRPTNNFATFVNIDLERIAAYSARGYSAQVLAGVEVLRSSKFPLAIEYAYGFNLTNYRIPREGFQYSFKGFNLHRLTFCNYDEVEEGLKKFGIGATFEYWHGPERQSMFGIGMLVIFPFNSIFSGQDRRDEDEN